MRSNVIPLSKRRAEKVVAEHKVHKDEFDNDADYIIQQLHAMANEKPATASIHQVEFGSSKKTTLVIKRIVKLTEHNVFDKLIYHPRFMKTHYQTT